AAPRPRVAAPPKPAAAPPPDAFAEAPEEVPPVAETAPVEQSAPPAPPQPAPAAPARPAQANGDAIPSDYVNQVYARINRIAAGRYPKAAALRRQEGRIGYTLQLAPSGQLIDFQLEPSGIEALDRAAAEALRAAAPFPPLPDLGAGSYRLSGAIVYRLGG
ncbi:TonB family protein, partial [Thauera linaloolentis]